MKKLILLTAVIFSIIISFAFRHKSYTPIFDSSLVRVDSFPNNASVSNASTLYHTKGGFVADGGSIITRFRDTATANLNYISQQKGGQIIVGNTVFIRDSTATRWIVEQGNGGSNISIINDSSIAICNLNSCDTFTVSNIVINNFSILNDSTIQVCDTTGACDTININPTPFNKSYVDSTVIRYSPDSVGVDSLYYAINGNKFLSGYIIRNTNDSFYVRAPLHVDATSIPGHRIIYIEHADGLVSGGIVTWSGTGLKFYVSPATYWIGGRYYESGLDSVTLAAADPTYSRYDLFVVDTTGHANKVTGQASMSPVVPQVSIGVELALTTAFTVNPGDTIPSNVALETIYNETAVSPEWTISHVGYMIMDSLNTDNPYSLIHDIFVSKYAPLSGINPVITFQKASADTFHGDDVIQFALYLNGTLGNTRLYFDLLKSGSYATQYILLDNGYVNKNDTNHYVLVTIPLNTLTWLNNGTFDAVRLGFLGTDTSGAKGLYTDKIILQHGINSVVPATDYGYKVDSSGTQKVNDSTYVNWYAVKGVKHYSGDTIHVGSGSGTGGSGTVTSVAALTLGTSGTDLSSTVASSTTTPVITLNVPTASASNRGALSSTDWTTFNNKGTVSSIAKGYGLVADGTITNTGTITVDSAALSLKYLRIADTAAMLAPYIHTETDPVVKSVNGIVKSNGSTIAAAVSGTDIKTLNGNSILGSGNITITGSGIDSIRKKGQFLDSIVQYSGGAGTFDFRTQQYFNVKDYGAVADGITDNTTAFQNTINACFNAGGGTIYIPYDTNTYKISGSLQTSISGTNPNSQLYIPLYTESNKQIAIRFLGGSPPNFVPVLSSSLTVDKQGAVIESTIQGTGTFPAIFGSPYTLYSAIGYRNKVIVTFENLILRTSTTIGGLDSVGTMSAINGARFTGMNIKNCRIDVSSNLANIHSPTNETYGVIYPSVNNNAFLLQEGYLGVFGYRYGVCAEEHFNANYISAASCYNGIVVDSGYHAINIRTLSTEGCVNSILMKGRSNLNIDRFDCENYTSGWNASVYNVNFQTPSSSVVSGLPYAAPVTTGFSATRSVNINLLNQVTPSVGNQAKFTTNDSTNVYIKNINNVSLDQSLQYLAIGSNTLTVDLYKGTNVYITVSGMTNDTVKLTNYFYGQKINLIFKQNVSTGGNIVINTTPIGVDYNPLSGTTKVMCIYTTNGWVYSTDGGQYWSQSSGNIYYTGGKVWVGTSSGTADLHVKKSVGSGGAVYTKVENTNSGGTVATVTATDAGDISTEAFGSTSSPSGRRNMAWIHSSTGLTNGLAIGTEANAPIIFHTNGGGTSTPSNERVRFDTSGNVGIGISSPIARLHIVKTSEQLRVGYDGSNYLSTTINSTGSANLSLTGTSPRFTFGNTAGFAAGTTALPGISFSGNTATGLMAFNSAATLDEMKAVSNTTGAGFAVQNNNSSGYSGIEYYDNTGTLKVFTGYENTGGNFRFNQVGSGGINFKISGTDKFTVNHDGSVTVSDKLNVTTGTNKSIGVSGAMTAGTITVLTTAVTASSKIFLTYATVGGTQGFLSVGTITAGTSFVINSSSATDTSTVNWWIIN